MYYSPYSPQKGNSLYEYGLYWTLDVNQTASSEITLVCLSVHLSQDWIISFF